jgi:5-methyltetrahydropteroyltriglutamate--homocysteine methyltransferase
MMDKLFPTQEIGSLAKPSWRIKGYRGDPLTEKDITEAAEWGRRFKIRGLSKFIKLLKDEDSQDKRRAVLEWSAKYALRFFEMAGLDIFYNGEQWRSEMYEHVIRNVGGFKFLGFVKSFDYRYFNKAACINKPKYLKPFYLDEFLFAKQNTLKTLKVPFTGPYTLVNWTFNEYYEKRFSGKVENLKERKFKAKIEFLFDLIRDVVRPEIENLVKAGARWIQIDEPAATTDPTVEEMKLFVESFNETVKGFNCTFSLHNCYSNYEVLAKYASELKNCSQLALEFANRDSRKMGTGDERKGYREIKLFEEHGFHGNYGIGVIDVHDNFIEPPELVRDRILHVAKVVGDPERVYASTDCGLRTRTWDVSFKKLRNMVLGAELARKALR